MGRAANESWCKLVFGARIAAYNNLLGVGNRFTRIHYNYHSYELQKSINLSVFFKKLRLYCILFCFVLALILQPYLQAFLLPLLVVALLGLAYGLARYLCSFRVIRSNGFMAALMTSIDFILIGGLIFLTGGLASVFHLAYIVPILTCVIRFGLKGGFSGLRLALILSVSAIFAPLPLNQIPVLFYFVSGTGTVFFIILTVSVLLKEEKQLQQELYTASVTDHLTGLYHSGYVRERLQEEIFRCRRDGGKFAIVFLDLDRFKKVNDSYGHVIGDQVLRHIAEILKEAVRGSETLARYGGDEFLLLMPGSEREQALQALRRLREAVVRKPFHFPAETCQFKIGISGGAAEYPGEGDTIERLLQAADKQMYSEKG